MNKPKQLDINNGDLYNESLSVSHLDDTKKCNIMTMSCGVITSMSLNKIQVKKLVNWLNRWIKFKDASLVSGVEVKNE